MSGILSLSAEHNPEISIGENALLRFGRRQAQLQPFLSDPRWVAKDARKLEISGIPENHRFSLENPGEKKGRCTSALDDAIADSLATMAQPPFAFSLVLTISNDHAARCELAVFLHHL